MAQFETVKRVIHEGNVPTLRLDVPFFSLYACRVFMSNFYYMSLKLFYRRRHPELLQRLRDAQIDFKAELDALQGEEVMKGYALWQGMGNMLEETKVTMVEHLSHECQYLSKTFAAIDYFLIPVDRARMKEMITVDELKVIRGKVKVLFGTMVQRFSEKVDDSVAG